MEARTKSGILLPPGVGKSDWLRYRCAVCGDMFRDGEHGQYSRHVVNCAKRHMTEIRESSPRHRAPGIFGDEGVDVEYRDYVRRTGRI
jgi:hypothetical protein